jgi:hypothetical protein
MYILGQRIKIIRAKGYTSLSLRDHILGERRSRGNILGCPCVQYLRQVMWMQNVTRPYGTHIFLGEYFAFITSLTTKSERRETRLLVSCFHTL